MWIFVFSYEFSMNIVWIVRGSMNLLHGLCGCSTVRKCAAVQQCAAVRQYTAVWAAVCGSAHDSVCAVPAVVCGSALGSVWQCAQQCAAVQQCDSVQQCGRVWQCERQSVAVRTVVCTQCAQQCAALRLAVVYGSVLGRMRLSGSAAVRGSVRQCAGLCAVVRVAVCGGVWQCVAVRTAVYGSALYICVHIVVHNIGTPL
jgi:hypothetical protein